MAAADIFWDTNILLDLIDRRPYELDSVDSIFTLALRGKLSIGVSESVVANTLYLSKTRHPHLAVSEFLKSATVLANNSRIITAALASSFQDKEDAILYHLALHHRCDMFISRDRRNFRRHIAPSLPVMSAKEFILSLQAPG